MTDVVIIGAAGRMGATLVNLAKADEELNLAGAVERSAHLEALGGLGCPVGSLDEVLPQAEGAVIVDFTAPEATLKMVEAAVCHGNPAVIGTTGFTGEQREMLHEAAKKTPLFWAPNMSVGVNVLLKVLPLLAEYLGPAYDMEVMEIHHKRKADSPSGTALRLAECLAEARGWVYDEVKKHCRDGIIGPRAKDELGVMAIRGGDVVGDHTCYFLGPGERIEVTHRAHSRETFAQGAMRAAKWLAAKPAGRLYTMSDIF